MHPFVPERRRSGVPEPAPPWTTPIGRDDFWTPGRVGGPGDLDDRGETASRGPIAPADLGALSPYAEDPSVTDLLVTGDGSLWSDGTGGLVEVAHGRWSEAEARALAVHLIALGGRHVDEANPCMDVRLAGGIRVHAVLPPVSTAGAVLSVRLPSRRPLSLADLCADGTVGEAEATVLREAIAERRNLLLTGATGSGKTTLLAALLSEVADTERIVVIEDVAELRVRHPHVVGLEARQPNLEGAGGIGLARLLREALRMRPDRIVLGECRGAEIRELLTALNTGHDGGAGTLHANSLDDVPARLEALAALASMTDRSLARQAVSALDLVVHLERSGDRRRIAGIAHLGADAGGRLTLSA